MINGCKQVTDLRGNTNQGDLVQAFFTVAAGGQATVSLVSYTAPDPTYIAAHASQQQIFDLATGTYGPGTYSVTVQLPNSYYQVDFRLRPGDRPPGAGRKQHLLSAQGRLISADNDGASPC